MRDKSAVSVAEVLYQIFCEVGFPAILQSDNGGENVNEVIDALVSLINARHNCSSLYNPRGNGVAECWIKKIGTFYKKNDRWGAM